VKGRITWLAVIHRAQVKAAVSAALRDLKAMDEDLPPSISLGLVQVNCVKARGFRGSGRGEEGRVRQTRRQSIWPPHAFKDWKESLVEQLQGQPWMGFFTRPTWCRFLVSGIDVRGAKQLGGARRRCSCKPDTRWHHAAPRYPRRYGSCYCASRSGWRRRSRRSRRASPATRWRRWA
jgi:hypothetical protein